MKDSRVIYCIYGAEIENKEYNNNNNLIYVDKFVSISICFRLRILVQQYAGVI